MDIAEFRKSKSIDDDSFTKVETLCRKVGNCAMNGYFATSLTDCSFDENGLLEFSSSRKSGDVTTDSVGCVLDNSLLVKQVQKNRISDYNKLYSWNMDEGVYTFLEFDDKTSLDTFYERIKRFGIDLCEQDLSTALNDMGLSFDNVTQVLINQKVDPVSVMMDEEMEKETVSGHSL